MRTALTNVLLALSAVTTITSCQGGPDRGYSLSGCRWPGADIAYRDDTASYFVATRAAAGRWNIGSSVVHIHPMPEAGWTVAAANLGPTAPYGYTTWSCAEGRFISVTTTYNTFYTDGFSFEQRVSVMTHEMGHALGLAHTSAAEGCPVAIMVANFSKTWGRCQEAWPQPTDIEAVRALYAGS